MRAVLCVGVFTFGSLAFAQTGRMELERFQGQWKFEKFEEKGKAIDAAKEMFAEAGVLLVTANKVELFWSNLKCIELEAKLDPSKNPKQADLKVLYERLLGEKNPSVGETVPAIYDFNDEVLRIEVTLDRKSRPSKIGEGYTVTFKRKK